MSLSSRLNILLSGCHRSVRDMPVRPFIMSLSASHAPGHPNGRECQKPNPNGDRAGTRRPCYRSSKQHPSPGNQHLTSANNCMCHDGRVMRLSVSGKSRTVHHLSHATGQCSSRSTWAHAKHPCQLTDPSKKKKKKHIAHDPGIYVSIAHTQTLVYQPGCSRALSGNTRISTLTSVTAARLIDRLEGKCRPSLFVAIRRWADMRVTGVTWSDRQVPLHAPKRSWR